MTDADRKDAFDLIQQSRRIDAPRYDHTRRPHADHPPPHRDAVPRLVAVPAVAIEHALDQLTRLNALVAACLTHHPERNTANVYPALRDP